MTTTYRIVLAVTTGVLCCASSAPAQSVSDVLTFLVTNQSVQTGNVARDRNAAQGTSDTIGRALLTSLATLPAPTASGAFTYRLNPELGTVERTTQTFGPFFVERAQTAGRNQVSFGAAVQYLRFDSLDGRNLRDGSLVTTANRFTDEAAPFDADHLTLAIDASVATFYGNVGITDRFDVGVIAPLVSLRVTGSRTDTYRGQTFAQASASSHAVGLADMIVRSKYALYQGAGGGVAAAVDVRLPTGRQEDLLGAGSASAKLSGIASIEFGRVATYGNAGVTVGGLAREMNYDAAVAIAASPRVTLGGEVLGRWIDGSGHVVDVATPHPTLVGVQTIRLTPDARALNVVTAVPGIKVNLSNTWVMSASVSIPLTTDGLTASFTPFFALDYALSR